MRRELERIEIPGEEAAEGRAWEIVSRAFAEHRPVPAPRRSRLRPVLVALRRRPGRTRPRRSELRRVADRPLGARGGGTEDGGTGPDPAAHRRATARDVRGGSVDRAAGRVEAAAWFVPAGSVVAARPLRRGGTRPRARRGRPARDRALVARAVGSPTVAALGAGRVPDRLSRRLEPPHRRRGRHGRPELRRERRSHRPRMAAEHDARARARVRERTARARAVRRRREHAHCAPVICRRLRSSCCGRATGSGSSHSPRTRSPCSIATAGRPGRSTSGGEPSPPRSSRTRTGSPSSSAAGAATSSSSTSIGAAVLRARSSAGPAASAVSRGRPTRSGC